MADGDLLAQFDAEHGGKPATDAPATPDLLAAFDKSLTAKPFGAGHPPPGAIAVQPRQPSVIERLGDFLGKTYGGGDKTANLSLGDLITGAHPNAQSQESGSPLVSGIERGLGAGALDLAGGVENLIGGVPAIVGGVVGHPEIGDRFFQTGDYLRDLANQVAAAGPQSGLAGGAQNVARGLAHYALGPELAAGAAATNSGVEGAQSGAPLNQQFKAAGLEGALAEAGGRIPITGKTLPVKLASGAGLGLAFPFAEHAGQHYVVGNDDVSPLPSLGEVATSEAMMLGLPLIHSAATKLGDVARSAPKPATQPAADTTVVEQALRAAGFSEDQIQAALKNGDLAEVARAATSTPAPALQGPPPDAPLPANATRALPAPEPRHPAPPALPPPPRQLPPPTIAVDRSGNAITNAQALAAARAADAAAQERIALGLTPDVQRAQQARQEGVLNAEADALQHGTPGESIRPEDRPEPAEPFAVGAVTDEPTRKYRPRIAQNGKVMRDAKGRPLLDPVLDLSRDHLVHWLAANGGINFKSLRESADVDPALFKDPGVMRPFGRLGDPALRRNGGMTVDQAVERMQESGWLPENDPNAPPTVGHGEATSMILDALNGHEVTHPYEGADERMQRQAAEHYADEARHEAEMAADREAQTAAQRADDVRALREHNARFADADIGDALTVDQWVQHAREAGVPDGAIRDALSREDWASTLHRLIRERRNGTDIGATAVDHGRGNAPADEGQIAEPGPAPHGTQGTDLFPAPTSAEQLRAAREAKDAERNGLNRREPTPAFTGTDLGATPHGEAPDQVDLTTPEAQSTTYERDVRQVQRSGTAEPEAGNVRSARAVPGQLDLFVATRGDRPVPKAEAPKLARLFQRAKVVTTGAFKSGIKVIRGWQDAAHIIAPLRKYPQEQFLAVVADAEGRPLAVLRHTMGTRDGSAVDAGNVFGSIAQIPGAKQVWFAHNHPSGHMQQSAADLRQTQRLHDLMRGSGIEAHGMIQIGPGSREATYSNPETGERGQQPSGKITPAARTGEVPIVERALRKIQSGHQFRVTSPNDSAAVVRILSNGETGVLLLDHQHRAVGFLPMSDAAMAHLRTGDPSTGAARVAAVANEATAAAVIPVVSDVNAGRNIGSFFKDADIRPLDIATLGEHGEVNMHPWGEAVRTDGRPFESQEPSPVREVSESDLSPADRELVQRTRARAAQAQDNRAVESALEQDSRARGEREAGELGLRGAVVEALGPDRMQNVHFVHDEDGLPESVRKRGMPIKRGNVRYGLHTPDGHSYIFTKHANTPERAAWTAIHEVGGHEGVAALVREHPDVKLGNRTLREAYESARKLFLQNPTVAKLADVIGKQRASTDAPRMAEEAMAELQAAARTGRWDEIARKYGVDVPKGVRQGVQGAMANFVRRLKAIVNAVYAKLTGKSGEAFTDADVHDMLDSMWQASKDRDAPNLDLVPFEAAPPDLSEAPAQIKSATGNRGTFDAGDPNILHSEEPQGPEHDATMGRGFSSPAIDMPEPKVEPKLPPRAPGESQAAWHARIIREQREPMRNGILRAAGIEPKSAEAKAMRDIGRGGLRAMWAKSQRAADKAAAAFSQAMAVFDRAGRDANLAAIDQWENGQEVTSAPHRLFFKAMDQAFNDRVDAIRKVAPGALEHVIENYFPHLWKDPTKAAKWYQQMAAKRPLDGNKSFLKQRVHDTIKDGMAAGLEPASTNPVDLVLAKMAQMDKFIALHQFRKDLQARGWLKEMEPGQRVPYGYARVDDPAFVKAAGLQGYFAVPELIARDINNHLSPGLNRFKGFRALRKVENLIMMARLGWSAFHAGFTTLDNLVMHADVGLRYMLQGDMKRSLTTLAKTPFSVVYSPLEGGKLNRQWLGLDDADVHTAALLDALEQGGAHWKMSRSDYNNDLPRFIRSLRQRDYGTSVKTSLSAAGEVGSWLIHHKLVPNQKMAARLLLAKFALDKFAKPLGKERGDYAGIIAAMHPDALKQIMGDVVNNVDDRLGQMNYDNQFWNKTARELAQTAIGAVGWQVGTVRTVTGGVRDVERLWNPEKLLSPLDKGGKITDADMGRISGRLTYLVSLALIMGGGNAALQYMMTGQGPSEVKDYFFPKTGRKNADGSDERLQFPSYWMDHYKLATHPLQTAEHKLHPILSMFMEAIGNQDYYGVEIRDPHASWMKQAEQVGEYLAKGFLPYSVTNNRKVAQNEGGIGRQAASFVGVTPAPASVSRSEFQTFVSHNGNKGFGHEKRTAADAEHSRMIHDIEQQVRNGGTPDLSGLSRRDMMRVRRESREEVPEIQFKKMDIEDKLDGWDMASPKERREYHLRNIILNSRGTHTDRFRRLPEDERHAILQRILQIRDGAPAQ